MLVQGSVIESYIISRLEKGIGARRSKSARSLINGLTGSELTTLVRDSLTWLRRIC
jgi:hypothetical protein